MKKNEKSVKTDILQCLKLVDGVLSSIQTNSSATFKFKYKVVSEENSLKSMTIRLDKKGALSVELTGNGRPLEFFDINPKGEHYQKILKCIEDHMS